ncbi:ATP-binding cassette domain-containing protein [Moraxella marmotae]|uniref:ATP-binding cassette domain-containing protein n=1 Tax=Moraxella marmotae TaxID=3344520 RepID=UPI0035F44D29
MSLWQLLFKKPFRQEFQTTFLLLGLGVLLAILSATATIYIAWCIITFIEKHEYSIVYHALFGSIIAGISLGMSNYITHKAELKFSDGLRQKVLLHILRLPNNHLSQVNEHKFRQLICDDIANLHYLIAHLPNEFIVFIVTPSLAISLLIKTAGVNMLVVLLPAVLASCYYLLIVPKVVKRDGALRMQTMQDVISSVENYTKGIRLYRSLSGYKGQSKLLDGFYEATRKFGDEMTSWVIKVVVFAAIATALLQVVPTYAIVYAFTGSEDIQVVLASLIFGVAAIHPISRLAHGLDYIYLAKNSAKNLDNFLSTPQLPKGKTNKILIDNIKLLNLSIKTNEKFIIENLNYVFHKGEVTMISGTSGSGKSTLLHIIAGSAPKEYGQILYGKTPIENISEQAKYRHILHIPQGIDMPFMTVRELLQLTNSDISDVELGHALNRVELATKIDATLPSLSGGERQRALLALVCLTKADVILLDECMSALDMLAAKAFMQTLKDFAQQYQKIIILVSHEPWMAELSDKHLNLGQVQSQKQGAINE